MQPLSTFRRYVGDTLQNLVNGLGTGKDSRTASTYVFNELNRVQLEAAFRSDWIARRVVMAPAEDATREWRAWQAEQAQIEAIEEAEKKFNVQAKVKKLIKYARLYGGGAIVLGLRVGRAEEPLDLDQVGLDDLRFIEVFHRYELTPGQRIEDIESEWFGQPEYYRLATNVNNVDGNDPKGMAYGVQIHPSRVIRMIGAELPDERSSGVDAWGDSVLQAVDEAIKTTGSVIGGIATMVVDAKMDVINVPGLAQKLKSDEETSSFVKRFQMANLMKSSVNTLLLDEKETWNRKQTQFGSLPQLIQEYLTIAAGASGIPVSRLLGMAKGKGLGGSEGGGEVDTRTYYDGISSDQKNEVAPVLNMLDEVLVRSALGYNDDSIYYEWNPLWQLSDTEKSAMALQDAQATQADVTAGLINPDALRQARVNQLIERGTYPGLQDAIDEHGMEPPEPVEPTPDDINAHIGMMQKSAQQLKQIGQAALPAPDNTGE